MRNFYFAIVKNKDHISFILSILISLSLLLNNSNPKMAILRSKTIEVVAFISSPMTWIKSLTYLKEENQLLMEKNLALSLQVESMLSLQRENDQLQEMLNFKQGTKLFLKPAHVVNKGIQPNLLSIVIDIGKEDNVFPNQPVLTPKGVIGKTIEAGNRASIVQLISDINYRLSVRILPSGATGILRWFGEGEAQVREVQKNVEINIGDKVVTSGFSEIYPAGLPVGEVAGVYDERGSFQKMVNVTLPNDISTFQYVFVLIGDSNEIK